MVAALDLGSSEETRAGSIPVRGTFIKNKFMFKFIKKMFQSNKNILTVGLNKTELDEYDKALILICGVLNVDLRKPNFFDEALYVKTAKSFGLKVDKSDAFKAIDLIFQNISSKRNHNEIVLQYLIKVMQIPSKIFYDDSFYKFVREAFERISRFYNKQKQFGQFESYCCKFIKPDWRNAFIFDSPEANFYRTFWSGWIDYIRSQRQYYQNYQNNRNYQKSQPSITKYYEILGISVTKDKAIIKSAYRKLCLRYHPDKGGSKEKFIEINQTYEYLITHV